MGLKLVQDVESTDVTSKSFLLLAILANYNKFEFRNPYRVRFEDFADEAVIGKLVYVFGTSMSRSRDRYLAIQEDIAEGWTLSSTLAYIGLGVLAPSKPAKPVPQATANFTKDFADS